MSSKLQERLYNYYYNKILALMRRISKTAKRQEDLCNELQVLRSTIAGLGGAQLSKEQKNALKTLLDQALKEAGCR